MNSSYCVKKIVFQKSALVISCFAIFVLTACSDNAPAISENLRKIGTPIQGEWQVAGFAKCEPEEKARNIKITAEQIELSNTKTNKDLVLLENMKQLESNKFIILTGKLNLYKSRNQRTLAYSDEGDKLIFEGFLVNGKLIKRKDLLEKYNADGNAKRNVEALDFNFCKTL